MKTRLIIFDMDGVIINSPALVEAYFLKRYPTITSEMMQEVLCGNFHVELEKLKQHHQPIPETPEEIDIRQKEYALKKSGVPMYPGIKELLEELHKDGYKLAVNTSALERNTLPVFEKLGITSLFDFIATAEVSKSKVEKFAIIEDKYKVGNENTLFITDTLGDVLEAKQASVPTIAVTWGGHAKSYFERESHDNLLAIVDTPEELKKAIKTHLS